MAVAPAATAAFDRTKGETQKYDLAVAAPAFVDSEFELHRSLLDNAAATANEELAATAAIRPTHFNARRTSATSAAAVAADRDHAALRRQYSGAEAITRPHATTPTSRSAIDAYVQQQQETPTLDEATRIRVAIPSTSVVLAPQGLARTMQKVQNPNF